ncbi:hypothetical protein EAW55_06545 [Legionella jordanis]|nr:hypothetical protein EAW55_06545 [Legionella jordanis]RMX15294.1 hypothetical protein EAS68_12850 [Legionella jordanis]
MWGKVRNLIWKQQNNILFKPFALLVQTIVKILCGKGVGRWTLRPPVTLFYRMIGVKWLSFIEDYPSLGI